MKKTDIKKVTAAILSALCTFAIGCGNTAPASSENASATDDLCIVTSFYPMQILTMNLVKDIDGVTAVSMSEPNIGCIHDHTFTTDDLKKIEDADIYIENGLGLETFNDRIKEAYPSLPVIEAGENITDAYSDGDEINGHVWTNPDDYIAEIGHVSKKLQRLDSAHAGEYSANEKAYTKKINDLLEKNEQTISSLRGQKALVLDEALPSFCIFTGMDILSIETDHEQEALSAGDIRKVIDQMTQDNIKIILISKDSDPGIAETIADETGATIYTLDSCMTGVFDEDAYLNGMQENFDLLSSIAN